MTHDTTLTAMALAALAEQQADQARHSDALDDESVRTAADFAAYVIGGDAAKLLAWEATAPEGDEVYAARADLPDTPGWHLRWASDGEDDTSLALHRPCAEGGHRDLVQGLAHLGGHLASLTSR
ncbi:hypothetical protein AB0D10_01225 [Kitasatospora sp. NPDC048545]|uniref:hypothetical protein n=1 Tax=Kitasatospora sp. NPDC048545 TaxID=3157208 RepID=UPI003403C2D4